MKGYIKHVVTHSGVLRCHKERKYESSVGTRMDLDNVVLSEVNKTHKLECCSLSYMRNPKNKYKAKQKINIGK